MFDIYLIRILIAIKNVAIRKNIAIRIGAMTHKQNNLATL